MKTLLFTLVTSALLSTGAFAQASSWAGSYGFEEAIPGQAWDYRLTVKSNGQGTLEVDGFQTIDRFQVTAESQGQKLVIKLVQDKSNLRHPNLHKGSPLFYLVRAGGKLQTQWQGYQPQLPASKKSSSAFQKK